MQYRPILPLFIMLCTLSCSEKTYHNIEPENYLYSPPQELSDGIATSSMDALGINQETMTEMIRNRLRFHFGEIDSVLVYKNDRLVLEEYFNGYTNNQKHDLRSTTKSITAILTGILIDEGHIQNENAAILPFFENDYSQIDNLTKDKNDIQLKNLLNMNSGFDCNDNEPTSNGNETRMYRERDWYKFLLDQPMKYPPGESYAYCTSGVNLIGGIIQKASNETITEFSDRTFFSKLGISDFRWSTTPLNIESTGGHLFLRPRDLLKIGITVLNNGQWQGEQIISIEWMEKIKTKTYPDYGYLWWKTTFKFDEGGFKKDIDAIYTSGNGGQSIFVFPNEDLVAVFTGSNFNHFQGYWGPYQMLQFYILPATNMAN